MADTPFDPFATHLDQSQAVSQLRQALHGAEDGELFFERRRSEMLRLDDGHLKTASYDDSEGFGLRAIQGPRVGYAHSTEISAPAIARAVGTARLALEHNSPLAPPPARSDHRLYLARDPMMAAQFGQKVALLREIDAYARAMDPRVVQASATITASYQEVVILRPEGQALRDDRPMAQLMVSVIVEQDGRRESGMAAAGGRHDLSSLMQPDLWQSKLHEALRIALVNLDAVPAPAGVMDVVLGPGWPGILLHEAIGHGLEGDFMRKGSSAFAGLMGQRIASAGVTVVDDGTLRDRRGSLNIDDEGSPTGCTPLIEDGILVGVMQDRQNARLMGSQSTGNGRRQSYAHLPMPRMTNTYMKAGTSAPQDLVAELKDGLYAVGFGGGQVDITNGKFVFSCTEAYRVKNGQIGAPVKGATLIGDGATALTQIRGVGNDLALDPGMGMCGKQGQSVPVGVGQPSIMIGGLTVGGGAG